MKYFESLSGKKVLVTGSTGFKGAWLSIWLKMLGAKVYGYALEGDRDSLYCRAGVESLIDGSENADIRNAEALRGFISLVQPEVVFHLAAEAIVGRAHERPVEAWGTNVMGTLTCLEELRRLDRAIQCVVITSDKCYENKEWVWGYRENDELGGKDMYSASKAAVEILVSAYKRSYLEEWNTGLRVATTRAGNVIGGGDRSQFRLVPDCIGKWEESLAVRLRNPLSTRPWQHVLEPLRGYMMVAHDLGESKRLHGESFNFGPRSGDSMSVSSLVAELAKYWPNAAWSSEADSQSFKESSLLSLNCDKATSLLGWKPTLDFFETAKWTSEWYKMEKDGADRASLCMAQIADYMSLVNV